MPEPLLIPKALYGTLDVAGKGWRRVINSAWKRGWKPALEETEWIDLWKSPGPIVFESRPGGILLKEYFHSQPFFAAYLTPSALRNLAHRELDRAAGCNRFNELHLGALGWPWYLFGMGYPHHSGFMLESDSPEEKAMSRAALKASLPHFLTIRQFEHRLSANGGFGAHQMMRLLAEQGNTDHPSGSWIVDGWGWIGVYAAHLAEAGMAEEQCERLIKLPSLKAYEEILKWTAAEGI